MKKKQLEPQHKLKLLLNREIDERYGRKIQKVLQVTDKLISRLGLEKELEGHTGCVNCLEWNERGTILASSSDDLRFILWDPFRHKRLKVFETGHQGNVFTVKFLPKTKDNTIVTGAADCRVRVHDVEKSETTMVCVCHTNRVKRVATAPDLPYMFWSAGEDGLILEFDLRAPHSCSTELSNVLINLVPHVNRSCEAKCLAINPMKPEMLAVGVNDPFIRLYDRRMIRSFSLQYPAAGRPTTNWERLRYLVSNSTNNLSDSCVQYFVAGHLPSNQDELKRRLRSLSTTYLTFSPSGNELLVNLGGEQIYLFDINNKRQIRTYDVRIKDSTGNRYQNGKHAGSKNGSTWHGDGPPVGSNTDTVLNLRISANNAYDLQHYTSAIRFYNKAVRLCPTWQVLYSNRAAAYMKRGWDGDMYAALRDCTTALLLDCTQFKAHFRLAKCLYELKFIDEAHNCLCDFRTRFPDQSHTRAYKALSMDIQSASFKLENAKKPPPTVPTNGTVIDLDEISGQAKPDSSDSGGPSSQELNWRLGALDYEARYCGHCNTTTDIKEANFFGRDGQYIVAGSDDGSFFIWDRYTTNIEQVLKGDESIVNCLQPHPTACLLATSGIDPVVRLWSPLPEDGEKNDRAVLNLDDAASANQRRMNTDPFDVMLMNMGYRLAAAAGDADDQQDNANWGSSSINCRPS